MKKMKKWSDGLVELDTGWLDMSSLNEKRSWGEMGMSVQGQGVKDGVVHRVIKGSNDKKKGPEIRSKEWGTTIK